MKIQELKQNGKPRNVPPIEVSPEFWERLKRSKVGKKRWRVVKEEKVKNTPEKDTK